MDYMIHAFGGQELWAHIYNGIARVFGSDSDYFTPVGTLSLTIGCIFAAMQAMVKTDLGIFAKKWFIPSFLALVFLFTPRVSVWIKDDLLNNAPIKVDNIPLAVALVPSLATKIAYSLSEMIEEQFLPANVRSSKVGLMFGAKVVGKLRDVKIQDPVLLDNTKQFSKQCFAKPWIMGNFLGKRKEAMETDDILGFIKQNIPNNFGIPSSKATKAP